MRVVVPFAATGQKSRLQGVLAPDERRAFARVMRDDVLEAVAATGHRPEVLATAPVEIGEDVERGVEANLAAATDESATDEPTGDRANDPGRSRSDPPIPVVVNERPLTEAVNARLGAGTEPIAVVMADLALATPAALSKLFATGSENGPGVVLAPGRGGGTNALVARDSAFEVDYHGASYRDHRQIAEDAGVSVTTVDSYRLGTDVDEPGDLAEVLLHATGAAREWLVDAGFELDAEEGRVGVARK